MCSLLHPKLHWLYGYLRLGQDSKPLPHCNLLMLSKLMFFPKPLQPDTHCVIFPAWIHFSYDDQSQEKNWFFIIQFFTYSFWNLLLLLLSALPFPRTFATEEERSCLHVLTLSTDPGTPKQRKMIGLQCVLLRLIYFGLLTNCWWILQNHLEIWWLNSSGNDSAQFLHEEYPSTQHRSEKNEADTEE